jgi:hypothetical protein
VEPDVNSLYWCLIHEFGDRTGVPIVMNTSFNLRGEPIVLTPTDAVRTSFSSGMDALVIGSFVVEKERCVQRRGHCVKCLIPCKNLTPSCNSLAQTWSGQGRCVDSCFRTSPR